MKKITVFLLFAFVASINLNAQAPSYVDFELDIIRLGYANPTGGNESQTSGPSFGIELRYNLLDDLSIGFGGDFAIFGDDFEGDTEVDAATEQVLSVDKYFSTTSGNRAFLGLGFGRYKDGKIKVIDGDADDFVEGESSFGVTPRIGYELGHVRFMARYNYTFKSEVSNHFNVGVALTLWGGYKG